MNAMQKTITKYSYMLHLLLYFVFNSVFCILYMILDSIALGCEFFSAKCG